MCLRGALVVILEESKTIRVGLKSIRTKKNGLIRNNNKAILMEKEDGKS